MKKSILAGAGVAALGFAALPFAGVFAATSTQFIDTLTVGVEGGCTIEDSAAGTAGSYGDRSFSATIAAGTEGELAVQSGQDLYTGGFSVSCNTTSGNWTVSVAASDSGDLMSSGNAISPLAANATMGGATSSWAIKSNASGTTNSNPYSDYKGYTAGTFLTAAANAGAVTFNPSYKAYVAPNQVPGNYTGTVTYTIALGA